MDPTTGPVNKEANSYFAIHAIPRVIPSTGTYFLLREELRKERQEVRSALTGPLIHARYVAQSRWTSRLATTSSVSPVQIIQITLRWWTSGVMRGEESVWFDGVLRNL